MVLDAESAPAMNQQLTLSLSKRPTPPPAPTPDTVPPTPPAACAHPRAYPGLEACYCPDCRKSLPLGSPAYRRVMSPADTTPQP